MTEIQLKGNNCECTEVCAECGQQFRALIPTWAFVDGDYGKPLCLGCIEDLSGSHAVELIEKDCREYGQDLAS